MYLVFMRHNDTGESELAIPECFSKRKMAEKVAQIGNALAKRKKQPISFYVVDDCESEVNEK